MNFQNLYFLCLVALFWHPLLHAESIEETILAANKSYQQGMASKNFFEREKSFNHALTLYTQVINQISYPSGELNQALANTFFQLNAYAWSILYYERALQLEPRNLQISEALETAQKKLGLENSSSIYSIWQKILFIPWISFGERVELFFYFFFLSIVTLSFLIWNFTDLIKKISIILVSISLLLLFNLLLSFYFSSVEGVLISSTGYYRAPDFKQSQLTSLPKRAGTKLRILAAPLQGSWLKVTDSEGLIGYIPASAIRII